MLNSKYQVPFVLCNSFPLETNVYFLRDHIEIVNNGHKIMASTSFSVLTLMST